jgi:glycosyltransferase involved in cell wall biosynthesis
MHTEPAGLAERVERRSSRAPYFSICIPHHNRTSFLIEACRSIDAQTFRDFEVCISDDCSTDGRSAELLEHLRRSSLPFVYRRTSANLRYDGNLRSAIALASGRFCLLLGNDDALAGADTLQRLREAIAAGPDPDVVFTNFSDYASGRITRRVARSGIVGSGPAVAGGRFRKFSFVSGVVLRREPAQRAAETRWDGSEMYQMYVGCRLIAAGGLLREADLVAVRKDIRIDGETVDSYARRARVRMTGIPEQRIPLTAVARLVIDALQPHLTGARVRTIGSVTLQYFGFLYPYWLLEYRRVQSWRFAAGVARAMRPAATLRGCALSVAERAVATATYGVATIAGLAAPVGLLRLLHRPARRVARFVGDRAVSTSRP